MPFAVTIFFTPSMTIFSSTARFFTVNPVIPATEIIDAVLFSIDIIASVSFEPWIKIEVPDGVTSWILPKTRQSKVYVAV